MLIHCRAGINRSNAIAAAFLMMYNGMTADNARQVLLERGLQNPVSTCVSRVAV